MEVAAQATPVASATPVAPAARAPKMQAKHATGTYRVQIAAVRSRGEAQELLARVQQKHAQELATREAVIDEAVVGNMGTLYRIRVGPYATANEPRSLCAKLKGDGLDCLIVTQ